jgi:hypothetical protein
MISRIDSLTVKYRDLIIQPDGSLNVGSAEQQKNMISSNFKPEELINDFTFFCHLPPYLIRSCIFPNENIVIFDGALPFFDLWALKTINYFNRYSRRLTQKPNYSWHNLEVFESLLLLNLQRERYNIIRHDNALGVIMNEASQNLFSCFAYPFLESLVRQECNTSLYPDGTIANIEKFPYVLKKRYEKCLVKNPKYKISNIGDELFLLTNTSNNPLRTNIEATLQEFSKCLGSSKDGYATITEARNTVLHGELGSKGAIAAKYLIMLILLSKITEAEYKSNFNQLQKHEVTFW